ncbi:MAG: T9SS type A sorting domain-containing protein [Chitinophagaceae bacterium]|nr:T9SS type A sorting domain-containing protein [Chitinophagaceae bacterium]
MSGGYGYNSFYTTPNDNYDSLWTISRLSFSYKLRTTSPFTYTGPYLKVGEHPFIMAINGNPLDGYYAGFTTGGGCSTPTSGTVMSSNWLSVFGDAGGQSGSIKNDEGDGYCYERCFYLCQTDTVNINLQILADDIVDTILVDNINLYTTAASKATACYTCAKSVNLNVNQVLPAGRHSIKIWTRDNAGGHLGLNVYGHLTSSGTKKNIVRSKFDSRCDFTSPILSIKNTASSNSNFTLTPNPSNGKFVLHTLQTLRNAHIEVFDFSAKKIHEQEISNAAPEINLNVAKGVYFIRLYNDNGVAVQKIIID